MGINWGNDNQGVREFDSIYGLTFPSVSGTQGGGNNVFMNIYFIQSYPTVIVIKPDHEISNQYVWEPTTENINNAILAAGGIMVGEKETIETKTDFNVYPNPASKKINLKIKTKSTARLEIIDSKGNLVFFQENISAGIQTVDISNFQAGLYFTRLITAGGASQTKKLIIR
jgi:hypothetical protein